MDDIYDEAGRYLAPTQVTYERPAGPWDANALVSVCAWCPDARERTANAIAAGHPVTHGLCPTCRARLLQEEHDASL